MSGGITRTFFLGPTFSFFTVFDGFYISDCEFSEFRSYEFWVDAGSRTIKKEGIYRVVRFNKKEGSARVVSGLQIIRNHANAIKGVGGEVLKESDRNIFRTTYNGKELMILVDVSAGRADVNEFSIYSIEVDAMKQEVSALDIKGSLESQGKMALYGILFDTGKSDTKPESEKAINTIATYLKENPEVNI